MAGPETPLATRGFDAAQAIESATAPGMAIVGAGESTNTGTRQTPEITTDPSAQQQFTVDVESPGYGWQLNRDDLGQGQVQQIRTDQFVTPVAEMKLPYGAIAARQDYVADRRSRLEAAKQATMKALDPFAGRAEPAAQHQAAFKKYAANTWWPELVGKWATAHGVTSEQAMEDLYSTPEGNAYLKREGHVLDGMAKESFGMTERVADLLERHQKGEITIFPEDMKVVNNWMSGKDHNGMPISGERPDDFLWKGRDLEGVMAFAAFQKQFTGDFDKYAEEVVRRGGKARYLGAGRWEMSDEEEKRFAPYKEAMVESAAEQGVLNGDKKRIRERLDLLIKDKVTYKDRGWEANQGGSGADGAKAKAWAGEVEEGPSTTSPWREGSTAAGSRVQRIPIGKVVDGRNEQFGVRRFTGKVDGNTQEVEMLPTYIERRGDGEFYISGLWMQKKTTTKEKVADGASEGSFSMSESKGADGTTEEYVEKGPMSVPVKGNEAMLKSMLGGMDWQSRFGDSPQKKSSAPVKAAKAPSFVIDGGYTQKDWDGLTDTQRSAIIKKGKL